MIFRGRLTLPLFPMFRIFDRYLGRQILVSTFFAVAVLSVVLVLGQIFKKLLDKLVEGTLPPEAILKFIGYSFPWSLSFTVPWGILTAVLLVFGRLSADNELIALRMSGQSLRRICLPVFVLAFLASGFCLWINTTVAPHSFSEIRRTTQQAVLSDPKAIFRPDTHIMMKTSKKSNIKIAITGAIKGNTITLASVKEAK